MVMRIASNKAKTHNELHTSVSVRIRSVIQRDAQIRQGTTRLIQMSSRGIKSGSMQGLGVCGCASQETGVMLQDCNTKKWDFF
jgi:hypothetical protein